MYWLDCHWHGRRCWLPVGSPLFTYDFYLLVAILYVVIYRRRLLWSTGWTLYTLWNFLASTQGYFFNQSNHNQRKQQRWHQQLIIILSSNFQFLSTPKDSEGPCAFRYIIWLFSNVSLPSFLPHPGDTRLLPCKLLGCNLHIVVSGFPFSFLCTFNVVHHSAVYVSNDSPTRANLVQALPGASGPAYMRWKCLAPGAWGRS